MSKKYKTLLKNVSTIYFLCKAAETLSGNFLISASRDKALKIWDIATEHCMKALQGQICWDLSQERKCIKMLSDVHDGFVNCLRRAPGTVKDVPAVYSGASGRKNDEGNGTLGAQRDKRGTIQVQMRSIRRHGRGGFKAEDFPRTEVAGDDPEPTDAYCCSSFIFRSCQLVLFQEK
ncbi:nuclear distribution protein PAC1 [Paracoccidioides brasiliensis]|nr:nuclear distribution protein PAC1 [Paracoccidioides brasiliensis]